jgi:hypothetical protein
MLSCDRRLSKHSGGGSFTLRPVLTLLFALTLALLSEGASAQQQLMMNPFAGNMAPGAPGPYGSAAGVFPHLMQSLQALSTGGPPMASGPMSGPMPMLPDTGEGSFLDMVVGACAGGAFLGGYAVATAVGPAAATGVAAPPIGTAVVSAAAIGCGLGVATAAVSLGASAAWSSYWQ